MTNVERQILLNQFAIMNVMAHILHDNNGSKQDIEDLTKLGMMTAELVNHQGDATDVRNTIVNTMR